MTFFTLAWKNLTRRPMRLSLTVLGLALAVAAIVSLVGLANGFERSYLDLYHRQAIDLVVQHTGGVMQLTRGIDELLQERISGIDGVRQVLGGLLDVVALEKYDLFAVLVNGWPPDSPIFDRITITAGRQLQAGDRGRILIGHVLAANTGKHVGDMLEVYGEPFEVVGIFESFSVYENGAVFMLLNELQRLTDRPGKVTGFIVETTQPGNKQHVEEVRQKIESLDPSLSATQAAEFVRNVSQIRVARAAAWITSAIAVTIGVAGTLNTMLMSVFERVREIGTLRAIGWRKRRVVGMVLCEALVVSSLGAAVGVALGLLAIRLVRYSPTVAGLVEGFPPPMVIAEGCLVAIVIGLLGAAYPAYWAARLSPVEALRAK